MGKSGQRTYTIEELISAINENRDIVEIQEIIAGVEDVNKTLSNGKTALYIAAILGNTAIIELILDRGADVNKGTSDGVTPLYIAAQLGYTSTVELLLDGGADVNKGTSDGPPLMIAVQRGHIRTVEQLLDRGADVNKPASDGATSLYMAAQNGHTAIMELLLKKGADVNKCRPNGCVPLMVAAQLGYTSTVELLLDRGADVNKLASDGATPLYIAAQNGHTGIVAQLLAAGADVNQARASGITPLYMAAQNGYTATVVLLLFATKLSTRPKVKLSAELEQDPIIQKILDCDKQGLFKGLRNNLRLIAKADKVGLWPDEYNSLSYLQKFVNRLNFLRVTQQRNTYQVVLSALYDHFSKSENMAELLETFSERISKNELAKFNLNDPQSLLTLLNVLKARDFPSEISAQIVEFTGAFSANKLEVLLDAHLNGKEVKDLITSAQDKAITQEGALSVFPSREQNPVSELIVRIRQLEARGVNLELLDISERNGEYIYHYDAGNGAAAMSEKPLTKITPLEKAELLSRISQKEEILSLQDPTTVTAIEAEVSFLERCLVHDIQKSEFNSLAS